MKIKKIFAAGLLSLAPLVSGTANAQEFVLKFAIPTPPADDSVTAWIHGFEKAVEEKTSGQIDVQLFFGGQLGSIPATIEGVTMGTIEAAFTLVGFLSALDSRYQVLDATGLFETEAHANRAFRDPEVRAMFAEFGTQSRSELLGLFTNGQTAIASKQPITTTADLEGIKIRSGGASPLINKPLETLGASPVSFSLGEVLPALQTGTLDASIANLQVYVNFKYGDVANQVIYVPGSFLGVASIISKDFLDRIGPDLAAAVHEAATESLPLYDNQNASDREKYEGLWKTSGGTLNTFDDAEKQKYLDITRSATADVLADNEQLNADYGILADAAKRAAE